MDCEGCLAALAHNVLKMVLRLGRGVRPTGPVTLSDAIGADAEYGTGNAALFCVAPTWPFWMGNPVAPPPQARTTVDSP